MHGLRGSDRDKTVGRSEIEMARGVFISSPSDFFISSPFFPGLLTAERDSLVCRGCSGLGFMSVPPAINVNTPTDSVLSGFPVCVRARAREGEFGWVGECTHTHAYRHTHNQTQAHTHTHTNTSHLTNTHTHTISFLLSLPQERARELSHTPTNPRTHPLLS